jgi:hypothetical protein
VPAVGVGSSMLELKPIKARLGYGFPSRMAR